MGRPRQHDEQTRAALLEAAERLLSEGGPGAVSVRAVAEAVGESTRAVYSVFGNKEGLFGALFGRAFSDLRARIEAVPQSGDPREDLLRAGVEGFRGFALDHPQLFRLTFERLVPDIAPRPEDVAHARAAIAALRSLVERCRLAGFAGGRDTHELAWQCHAFCQGLASLELQGLIPATREHAAFWRDALGAFVAGLDAPGRGGSC
jgi:AcrR family transcriptional regulator